MQGGPTREQALRYFEGSIESAGEHMLVFVSDVKIEAATRSRALNLNTDDMDGIDTGRRVFDIHGSFTEYECAKRQARAKGICYHEWGSNWRCMVTDDAAPERERTGVAPPQYVCFRIRIRAPGPRIPCRSVR